MMVLWMVLSVVLTLFYHQDVFHDRVCPFGAPQGCLAKHSLLLPENAVPAREYQGFTKSVLGGGKREADKERPQAK